MDILLWIAIAVFLAFVIVAMAFIIKLLGKSRRTSDIHISGGANVERGYLSDDHNYFMGGYQSLDETVVIGVDYRSERLSASVYLTNLATNRVYELNVARPVVLGRVAGVDTIAIEGDGSISKIHCRLYNYNNQVYVEDLGSVNHTMVNSRCINEPCIVNRGDIIKIGSTQLRVDF